MYRELVSIDYNTNINDEISKYLNTIDLSNLLGGNINLSSATIGYLGITGSDIKSYSNKFNLNSDEINLNGQSINFFGNLNINTNNNLLVKSDFGNLLQKSRSLLQNNNTNSDGSFHDNIFNFGSISQNHPEIGKRVEATIDSIELSKKVEESQSLVNILEKDIYPIIEDLLKDFSGKKDEIKKKSLFKPRTRLPTVPVSSTCFGLVRGKSRVAHSNDGRSVSKRSGVESNFLFFLV